MSSEKKPGFRTNRDLHVHVGRRPDLWVDPLGFRGALFTDDRWIISGRKGSGKSSVVEQITTRMNELLGETASELRPSCVVETISLNLPEIHEQIVAAEQSAVVAGLDTVVDRVVERYIHHEIMRVLEDADRTKKYFDGSREGPGGAEAAEELTHVRVYLTGRKATKRVNHTTRIGRAAVMGAGAYFGAPNAADEILTGDYRQALHALEQYIARATRDQGLLFCIDHLDTHGFRFGTHTRAICEAAVNFCMRYNEAYRRINCNTRIWLCIPSEIFRTLSLWNSQEVSRRTFVLHWSARDHLRRLVNLRLLSKCGDIMREDAGDGTDAWERMFPSRIVNFRGVEEDSFDYLLRHTFYLPKDILEITEYVVHELESLLREGEREIDWNQRFQQAVRTFTQRKAGWICDLYDQIYPGFRDFVFGLTQMPAIMERGDFESRVGKAAAKAGVHDRQTGKDLQGEKLLRVLYLSGVVGQFDDHVVHDGKDAYTLNFAYYHIGGKVPQPDIQFGRSRPENRTFVVSPVFNHVLSVKPLEGVVISPHAPLPWPDATATSSPPARRV